MSERRPLWTPEEARAEADPDVEPLLVTEAKGCAWDGAGCMVEGCLTAGFPCLLFLGFLLLR